MRSLAIGCAFLFSISCWAAQPLSPTGGKTSGYQSVEEQIDECMQNTLHTNPGMSGITARRECEKAIRGATAFEGNPSELPVVYNEGQKHIGVSVEECADIYADAWEYLDKKGAQDLCEQMADDGEIILPNVAKEAGKTLDGFVVTMAGDVEPFGSNDIDPLQNCIDRILAGDDEATEAEAREICEAGFETGFFDEGDFLSETGLGIDREYMVFDENGEWSYVSPSLLLVALYTIDSMNLENLNVSDRDIQKMVAGGGIAAALVFVLTNNPWARGITLGAFGGTPAMADNCGPYSSEDGFKNSFLNLPLDSKMEVMSRCPLVGTIALKASGIEYSE